MSLGRKIFSILLTGFITAVIEVFISRGLVLGGFATVLLWLPFTCITIYLWRTPTKRGRPNPREYVTSTYGEPCFTFDYTPISIEQYSMAFCEYLESLSEAQINKMHNKLLAKKQSGHASEREQLELTLIEQRKADSPEVH